MNLKRAILAFAVFSIFSCHNAGKKAENETVQTTEPPKKLSDSQAKLLTEIDSFNKLISDTGRYKKNIFSSKVLADRDTLVLHLFTDENLKPVILKYSAYDDGGSYAGSGYYFFSKSGQMIGHKTGDEATIFFTLFKGNDTVFQINFPQPVGSAAEFVEMDKKSALSKETYYSFDLANYMQFLPMVRYRKRVLSPDLDSLLKVRADSIKVYSSPDVSSKVMGTLRKGIWVTLLNTSDTTYRVDSLKWIWYKIDDKKGNAGWVFGHPTLIRERNDEED